MTSALSIHSLNDASQTMSSREIAQLCGMRHDNVLRTARQLVEMGVTQSEETQEQHPQNQQLYPVHRLNFRDSVILVARLTPQFTAQLVDRWMDLEKGSDQPALLELQEQMARLAQQVEQQKQSIKALESSGRVIRQVQHQPVVKPYRSDLKSTTQVAKSLGITAVALNQFLRESGVKMKCQDLPTVKYMDWFECYAGTNTMNGYTYEQCKIKPEGVLGITQLWNEVQAELAS